MKITKTESVGEISSKRTLHFSDVGMTIEDILFLTNNAFRGEGLYEEGERGLIESSIEEKVVVVEKGKVSHLLYIGEVDGFKYYCESSDPLGEVDWHTAKRYAASLEGDWEVPNRVVSLMMYGNKEVRKSLKEDVYYWTSEEESAANAWGLSMSSGHQYTGDKTGTSIRYVRPVLKIKSK